MKKMITFACACLFALCMFCGSGKTLIPVELKKPDGNPPVSGTPDKNVSGTVNELLSVEELVEFHENGNKYPENFVFEELNGYGRVLGSVSSEEEARAEVETHFTSGWCTTVENRLDVETDLFYGMYAKWAYQSSTSGEPTYYDEYVVSFKKDAYDAETKRFGTKDEDEIKKILDYIYYSQTYQASGSKVYCSDISLKDGKYEYVIYFLQVCYGDWGLQDTLSFIKDVHEIDAETGVTSRRGREYVGAVFIDGACTHGGIIT